MDEFLSLLAVVTVVLSIIGAFRVEGLKRDADSVYRNVNGKWIKVDL